MDLKKNTKFTLLDLQEIEQVTALPTLEISTEPWKTVIHENDETCSIGLQWQMSNTE